MTKIRILHCIRQGQVGGGESHILDLVSNLNPNQFESIVLAFTSGPMIHQLKELNIQHHVIPTTKPFDFTIWSKVKEFIKANHVDLVHIHGTRAYSNTFAASMLLKKKIIYTVHGWSFNDFQSSLKRKLAVTIEECFIKISDTTINVSHQNRLIGKQYIKRLNSIVIQNGIDTEKFNPDKNFKDIRKELNIPDERMLIGYIARMTKQKDPITLIRAFNSLIERGLTNYHLLIVGDGELTVSAKDLVNKLGISSNVSFEGFRSDIPDILNSIDIYCLPSLWEGLPVGLLEAMAMKKVVIATNVDGTKEVIHHGVNGFLFNVKDYSNLSNQIVEVTENAPLRKTLQENAHKTIANQFSLSGMIKRTEEIYSNLLNGYHVNN
ncbi:MAG: glycosyltransferase family 4 protein [Cyclobacteriaceae bacterium]|nr:glycosyltransferase family 4 protein [Cyclobacteriaceae bacterium]